MTATIGSGGNKDVIAITIGTTAGNKDVLDGWIGDLSGNRQFFATTPAPTPTPTPTPAMTVGITPDNTTWQPSLPGYTTEVLFGAVFGGTAPYTYLWSAPDGGATPQSPTGSSSAFVGGPAGALVQLQATDSLGQVAYGYAVILDGRG